MNDKKEKRFDKQLERNLKAKKLEKAGNIDGAIRLYEENIEENFEGNYPYDRLAIIYKKRNQINEEIRVLKKAIWVFENIVSKARADKEPKLDRFKERLKKAKGILIFLAGLIIFW